MGKIYNKFSKLEFTSESSVEQKFVYPFLTDLLGYKFNDIIPQKRYKSINIPLNRNKKIPSEFLDTSAIPDFLIKDANEKILFILDAKKPDEDVSNFKHQLYAYALNVDVNFIVITNGYQFYIYDGPEIIIECNSLEEIDKRFSSIKTILHKRNQGKRITLRMSEFEKDYDPTNIISLPLSDYTEYLKIYSQLDEKIVAFDEFLPRITDYDLFQFRTDDKQILSLPEIILNLTLYPRNNKFILKGNSGIGKTEFVNYLLSYISRLTLKQERNVIPVKIELTNWNNSSSIIGKIKRFIKVEGIKEQDIEYSISDGHFMLFFDSLDEIPQNSIDSFFRELTEVEKLYPNNCYILISKPGIDLSVIESDREVIWMEPPDIDDLDDYINSVLVNFDFKTFYNELKRKNLVSLTTTPIMLNYLMIYLNKLDRFPKSKFEILEELISYYFEKYLGKKFNQIKDLNIIREILSLIAYNIIFKENDSFIAKTLVNKIVVSYLKEKRENYEIISDIGIGQIIDFLLKYNFIRQSDKDYLFWHPYLLEYFSAFKFINIVKDNMNSLNLKEIFHNLKAKEIIKISQPLIQNEEFNKVLRTENIFLFITSQLQREKLSGSLQELIKEILLEKLESKYLTIRRISMKLINEFLIIFDDELAFFTEILPKFKDPERIKWILDSIGHLGTEEAYSLLNGLIESYDDTYVRDPFQRYPLIQFLLIPLSNFDEQEVQNFIINEIVKKWRGVNYLKVIGESLENIARRGKLTQNSINKLLKIYQNPPDFDLKIRLSIDIRRDTLERVFLTVQSKIDLTKFLLKIIKNDFKTGLTWDVEILCGKTLKSKYVDFILQEIKDSKNDLEYRNALANVVRYSEIKISFRKLFNILKNFKKLGLNTKSIDLKLISNDYKKFKEAFPIYEISYIFHLILEHFLNQHDIEESNQKELINFLKDYLDYPHELILESVYKLIAKYHLELLLKLERVYLNRSIIEFLKPTINYNLEKCKRIIQQYFKLHLENPEEYHDHLLIQWITEILLDSNQTPFAIELFNKYLDGPAKVINIAFSLRLLEKFPSDYAVGVLRKIKQKILDSEEAEIHHLVFNLPLINDPEYVRFCLDLADIIPDWDVERIFSNMGFIKPYKFEMEIINFLQKKIFEEHNLVAAFNVLFNIGTEKSIEFLSQFLDSDNELQRNKAFFCIKYIYEKDNVLWYNNEEKYLE